MKGYKLLSVILSAVVFCSGATAGAVVYENEKVDIFAGTVEISGRLDTFNSEKVLLTTATLKDSNFSKDDIIYNNEESVGKDGSFNIKFGVDNKTIKSGTYLLYLSGEGMENINTPFEIVYYTPDYLKELLKNEASLLPENVNKEQVESFLETNDVKFRLDKFSPYSAVEKATVAEAVAAEIKNNSDIVDNVENFIECIQKTAFVIAANQSKTNAILESATEFCIDLSEYDETAGINCTEIFKDELTDKGRENIISKVIGKDFKNIEEWYDTFSENCFVNVISNNNALGYAYVNEYLEGNKFGVDTSEYEELGDRTGTADRYIVANADRIIDIESLKTILDEAVEKAGKDENSGGGSPGGGGGGSSGGFVSPIVSPGSSSGIVPSASQAASGKFSDLESVPWAVEAISALAEKNILNGRGNGTFDPDGNVTREEFAKLVVNMFNISAPEEIVTEFTDTVSGEWYEEYVNTAAACGIVGGYGDGRFGIGENITRQDCTVMLLRAMEYIGKPVDIEAELGFADADDIDDYAKDAVKVLSGMSIINGKGDNLFIPKAFCSRAEAAVMLFRLMEQEVDNANEDIKEDTK